MEEQKYKHKLESSLEFLKDELKSIRTGRATPAIVENVKVDYYNNPTPLKQLAAINTPEPRLIVISPYDKSVIQSIEKAISISDLNLQATNDGNVLRINIPPLTEERREDIVRIIHKKAEDVKVSMRNTRREYVDELEEKEKSGEISEDDKFKGEKSIQETLDEFMKKVDEVIEAKEKEIREV